MKKYLVALGLLASFAAFADDDSYGAGSENGTAVQQDNNIRNNTPTTPDSQQPADTDSSESSSLDKPDSGSESSDNSDPSGDSD